MIEPVLYENFRAWRDAVAQGAVAQAQGKEKEAAGHFHRAEGLQLSIEVRLRGRGQKDSVPQLAVLRGKIESMALGISDSDPSLARAEIDAAIADFLRGTPPRATVLGALEEARARLRVHVEGPFIANRGDIDKLADAEAARLIEATGGRLAPLEARQVLRGELYAQVLASPRWKWASGSTADRAMQDAYEALLRALLREADPSHVPPPPLSRAAFEALLIQIAHQIQEEISLGEGTDADVDRLTRLWRYALTPFLRPYVARERPGATADELRGPFEWLVHDLVELAFRELGHARITAPPFGGRSAAEWFAELRRRREGILRASRNAKSQEEIE